MLAVSWRVTSNLICDTWNPEHVSDRCQDKWLPAYYNIIIHTTAANCQTEIVAQPLYFIEMLPYPNTPN